MIGKPTPRETNNFAPRIFTREGAAVSHPAPSRLGSGHCPPLCGSCCCGPEEGFSMLWPASPQSSRRFAALATGAGRERAFPCFGWLPLRARVAFGNSCGCWKQADCFFTSFAFVFWGSSPQTPPERLSLSGLCNRSAPLFLARSPFSPLSISCPDSHCLGAPNQNTRSQYYPR